jgi:hypothetical protein
MMRLLPALVCFVSLLHLFRRTPLSLAERLSERRCCDRRSDGCSLPLRTPGEQTADFASNPPEARIERPASQLDSSSLARCRSPLSQSNDAAVDATLLRRNKNAATLLRILAETPRGGGTFGSTNAPRGRRRRSSRGRRILEEEEAFDWDDAAKVLRSLSTRTRIVWRDRVQPFLQHRVLPALRGDPDEALETDRHPSSGGAGACAGRPVAPSGRWGASAVAMRVGCVQHFVLLSVAGYVVGDLLPSSSTDDFELILGIAVRKDGRSQGENDESAFKLLADWWTSVLRDPANAWTPLSRASPRVQRAAGAAMGILASRLLRPIVPAAIRVAIGAMVVGEANAFLCGEYGEGWYETGSNDNVDKWLHKLDDALEQWRQTVRSALQDPSRIYKRVRRKVDVQLQQRFHVPTHVANGVIGGVVVGLVVA